MHRSRPWFSALFLTHLLLLLIPPAHAGASATVDRTELALGETLALQVETSGLRFTQPDLAPLERDFDVLGTSQSSQTQLINGKLSNTTSWQIQLTPRRTGTLQIPPLVVGKEKTDSISIQVSEQPAPSPADDIDIMIELTLAETAVYVGAQTRLTLRITAGVPANIRIDEPQHGDARIEQVNKVNYQQVRGGQQLRVTEYTYVLIPTQTGQMQLDPVSLVAEIASQQPRSLRRPFLNQHRRIVRRSEALTLDVLPPPDGIDPTQWLPARKVTLREQWSRDPETLKVGESVTRSIEFRAEGALAAQLPALFMTTLDGLKTYPDQPTIGDSSDARGINGQRLEKVALVATKPGRFELPEMSVAWWDVTANAAREVKLPARVIEVVAAAAGAEPGFQQAEGPTIPLPYPVPPREPWYSHGLWWGIACAQALGLLVLGLLYARSRQQLQLLQRAIPGAQRATLAVSAGEKAAYKQLQKTCAEGDARAIYDALLNWARCQWGKGFQGIGDLSRAGANSPLVQQANHLQQSLYGHGAGSGFQPQALLEAVTTQRAEKTGTTTSSAVPPLYPS